MKYRNHLLLSCILLLLCAFACLPAYARKVRTIVTAYHSHRRTATGTRPHRGTCAAPRRWLGCYVKIKGVGTFKVTDVCRRGIDIWLPSTKACRRWGRRTMTVTIERPQKRAVKRTHVRKKQKAVSVRRRR